MIHREFLKKQKSLLPILMLFILVACKDNERQYWDVSKFKMDDTILEDNEEIKILYQCGNGSDGKKTECYSHYVVVSQKSGDTVNVLSFFNVPLEGNDPEKIYNFLGSKNTMNETINAELGINSNDPKITKVARDPNFDTIADNRFPAILGSIGIVTHNPN